MSKIWVRFKAQFIKGKFLSIYEPVKVKLLIFKILWWDQLGIDTPIPKGSNKEGKEKKRKANWSQAVQRLTGRVTLNLETPE